MARIMSRLADRHRHFALPQRDAERQARKTVADNRDAFCFGHGSTHFLRDEKVAEDSRASFRQPPSLPVRPKRRKFLAGKTGAHADHGIVTSDVIAANHPQQPAAKQWPRRAARLEGDE